ncbi:MAG: cell division protein FtsX [Gammaproteobacteria bacterium]
MRNPFIAIRRALYVLSHSLLRSLLILLILPLMLWLPLVISNVVHDFNQFFENLSGNTDIAIYLKPNVSQSSVATMIKEIKLRHDVTFIKSISPDHGLKELEAHSGLTQLNSLLKVNPLPYVLIVRPATNIRSVDHINELNESLSKITSVDNVVANTIWFEHMFHLLSVMKHVLLLASIFCFLPALIVCALLVYFLLRSVSLETFTPQAMLYLVLFLGVVVALTSDYLLRATFHFAQTIFAPLNIIGMAGNENTLASSLGLNTLLTLFIMVLAGWIAYRYKLARSEQT